MGCGVYVTSSIAVALDHATVNNTGQRYVFVVDALIGKSHEGKPCDREPPIRQESSLLRFECTVDTTVNPTKFAVYADYCVLLRYLIEFTERAPSLTNLFTFPDIFPVGVA